MGSYVSTRKVSTSTTTQKDNRVIGEMAENSILVGPEANLTISNYFSPDIKELIESALEIGGNISADALDTADMAIQSVTNQNEKLSDLLERADQGEKSVYTDTFPYLIGGVLAVGVLIFLSKR